MESLNVKNINDEKIFNVIDPNGQGEVVNRIRPISVSINQKAQTINDQTDSTINLAVYWNDTWKSILDLTFDESLRQEYGKLTQDLTNIQKDIDMKQYKDAETKTADFLKYVANLSSKYTAIPEKAVVSKTKNDFVKVIADKNSVKATISDKLLNFMLKKYAKVDTLDYTKANECFSTSKFNFLANNYDFYYHSPEIFQKQAYMTVVKDNKVVGSYKVNYDQFSKFASKFMLTPQKLGYSKDRLAGYMKTAEVVMQNIFFDSVDEAKEWQEMVDEKKKEQATTPEGEEETTETTTTETKTEMGEGKSESPIKEDGGLARPSEDFASDEIPESEPRQQEQQGGGQNLGASRRVNLLKKRAGVRQTQKINNTINDIKQYYNELNQKSKEELMKIVMETYYKDLYNDVGEKDKKILEKKFLENENEEIWKQRLIKDKYTYDKGYDFAFENWGPDEQNINEEILALLNRKMIPEEFYKGVLQGLMAAKMNDIALQKERNRKRRQKYHETKEEWKDIGKMYGESSKEKNLTKTARVGYNAEPENMEEEVAIDLADELMSAANVALEKAGLLLGGYSGEEQRRQRVDVQKNAIEPLLKGRLKESIQGKVIDLIKEHLTDLNYHTLVSAIEEIMDGKQASKKIKLNKKAGIDMNLSYGHFLKEEDENKLPKFNTLEDIKTYIKTNNKFPGNFFYKGGLFTEDEYDMDGMVVTYGSPEIDKSIIINTPDNRYNYKGNYKNLDMDIVEEDAPYFRTDVNYTLPKKVYEELFPKKNSNKNLKLNKKADNEIERLDKDDIQMIRDRVEIEKDFGPSVYKQEELDMMDNILKVLKTPQDVRKLSQEEKKFIQDKMEVELVYARDGVYDDKQHKILKKVFQQFVPKNREELKQFIKKQLEWFDYRFDIWKENHLKDLEGIVTEEEAKQIYNELLEEKNKQSSKTKKLNKKALYGDVQEQDIVPAKTETKVYLQSEKVEDFVWLINSSGRIEILAPKALVMGATGSGDNSEGVNKLRDYIKKDLEKISVEEMQKTVSEYGVDNVKEMDKDELERYLVWLLAGDTADNLENRLADEEDLENIKAKNNPNVQKQAEDKGNKKQLPNFSVTVRRNSDDEVVDIIECNNQKEAEETYKYMLSDLDKDCYVSINKLVGKEEYEEIKNSSLNKEESCKKANENKLVNKQAEEQTVEEKIEEAETSDIVKGKIGVGDIVTVCIDKLEYPEEAFKYTELIGEPLILMENDKEDINKVIVEQTEYPFQRMTVNKDDICQYAELQGADIVVEDVDGDEMITTFEELPVVAKQCKIKSIHKAANINKKKANLTKKAINSLEDVAGLIDDILSDYDWYDYADQLEVGEKSHYENILADLQKDEKGTIEALFNRVSENDEEYSSPKIEQLKEYYNNKFSDGGK